jgi:hypothetical protein
LILITKEKVLRFKSSFDPLAWRIVLKVPDPSHRERERERERERDEDGSLWVKNTAPREEREFWTSGKFLISRFFYIVPACLDGPHFTRGFKK